MMYSGKHARPGGTGGALPLNEVSLDDLQAEDALDRSSHDDMHRLLGAIHVRGISVPGLRLQSPIYLAGSRRPGETAATAAETRRDGGRADDTVPLVKCDTIPLVRVQAGFGG